jgi:hypothetical protein
MYTVLQPEIPVNYTALKMIGNRRGRNVEAAAPAARAR